MLRTSLLTEKSKKNIYTPISLGVLAGIISILSPLSLFMIVIFVITGFLIYYLTDNEARGFLLKIFTFGIAIRVILLMLIHFLLANQGKFFYYFHDLYEPITAISGDDGYYVLRSWKIAQVAAGMPIGKDMFSKIFAFYGHSSYLYWLAFLFYLFGFSPISVALLNCFFSVLTGICIFLISRNIFGIRIAKLAASLVTFWPSLVLWSVTNLKDTAFILFFCVLILSFLRFIESSKLFEWKYLFLAVISTVCLVTIRYKFTGLILTVIFLYILFLRNKAIKRIAIIAIMLVLLVLIFNKGCFLNYNVKNAIVGLVRYHIGNVKTGGSCYKILADRYYGSNTAFLKEITYLESIGIFLKAWFYFLVVPFPWSINSNLQLISLPQIAIWYFFLLFSILGMILGIRYKTREALILLGFLFFIGSFVALTSGNIGTVFRHRDMVTPLFLIFTAVGMCGLLDKK